jgi:hypothetical protein
MSFSLSKLTELQSVSLSTAWIEEQDARAVAVAKYRAYNDGDHDASYLTPEMRKLLRITDSSDVPFAANYCKIVVNTLVDRLEVTGIASGNDAVDDWVAKLLKANRFDAMSHNVHESLVTDGDTFVMVPWDNAAQRVVFTHEYAYDGTSGIIPLYRSRDMREIACVFKIWQVEIDADTTQTRVNVYFPDRIERYAAEDEGKLEPFSAPGLRPVERWVSRRDNAPIGIPLVHFKNRGRYNYGESEIAPALGPQDALNRIWYSLILNTEYTGFSLLFALGFNPPGDLRPGSLVTAVMDSGEPPTSDQQVDFRRIAAGSNAEFLDAAQYVENVIGRVTRTPAPEFVAPTASGEARKQAEAGLVGKARRLHVSVGNNWEDVVMLAARVQAAFGAELPPELGEGESLATQWRSPELRNDVEVTTNTVAMAPFVDLKTTLEGFAPVTGWSADKIQEIMDNKAAEKQADMNAALQEMPGFQRFDDRFEDRGDGSGMQDEMPQMEQEDEELA